MPKPRKISLKGRWCVLCNGAGLLGSRHGHHNSSTDILRTCPQCEGVGFVGLTSEQVRQAELNSRIPA